MAPLQVKVTKIINAQQQALVDAIVIAAAVAQVEVEIVQISVPDVPKVSPFGQIPVVETAAGPLTGAAALKFIAQSGRCQRLAGVCPGQKAKIDEYVQIVPHIFAVVGALEALEKTKSTDNDKINALNKIVAFIKPLNDTLINNTFLLGNHITIADIYIAVALKSAFENFFGPKKRQELSSVYRWFQTVVGQKQSLKVVGVAEIKKEDVYLMPDLTKIAEAKPEVKKDDPIAKLPRSSMNFEDVKKIYCKARPYNPTFGEEFWPIFDASQYQCFKMTFKYNADEWEASKLYLCENALNGFISRGEQVKRNAFINLNVVEVDGFLHCTGAAIIRGTPETDAGLDMPYVMTTVSDAEEYDWEKIDVSTDAGKAEFIKQFCAPDVNGKEILLRISIR